MTESFKISSGFTLVELMIVIAIVGLLSAVALPQYGSYRRKAKSRDLLTYTRACAIEQAAYCSGSSNAAPAAGDCGECDELPTRHLPSGEAITAVSLYSGSCSDGMNSGIQVVTRTAIGMTTFESVCSGDYDTEISCRNHEL